MMSSGATGDASSVQGRWNKALFHAAVVADATVLTENDRDSNGKSCNLYLVSQITCTKAICILQNPSKREKPIRRENPRRRQNCSMRGFSNK